MSKFEFSLFFISVCECLISFCTFAPAFTNCLVVWCLQQIVSHSFSISRSTYIPYVGDKLTAHSTPFATYCPEVFHNTMTTGHVCKLIGQSVFLTDVCHLPHTEGAGLRRRTE